MKGKRDMLGNSTILQKYEDKVMKREEPKYGNNSWNHLDLDY